MALSKEKLVQDIGDFAESHFRDRTNFGCAYGSYLCGTEQPDSDLDVFFASQDVTPDDIRIITAFIVQYHIDNALQQDEEVPYENKLVVTYQDVDRAASLEGLSLQDGRIIVPPIIKEKSFLSSLPVRYRLLFNALTSPHAFFGNDCKAYEKFKGIAEGNLVRIAADLIGVGGEVTAESLMESLFRNRVGEEGEMFLGYKRNPVSLAHIKKIIQSAI